MSYIVNLSERAIEDSDRLEQDDPKAYKKFLTFLTELEQHPRTGTGHPEPLQKDDGVAACLRSTALSIESMKQKWLFLSFQPTVTTTTSR